MKRAENQPVGRLHLYGGIYLREMLIPDVDTLVPQHIHTWAHLSYVAAGAVKVWQDDAFLGEFRAPDAIQIPAGKAHRFLSLEPMTLILCVHATDLAEVEAEPAPLELED